MHACRSTLEDPTHRPTRWLDIVRAAGDEFREGEIISHVESFGLLTDVAHAQWSTWLAEWRPARGRAFGMDDQLLARAVIDRTSRELGLTQHRYLPLDERYDDHEPAGWEPWLCLSAPLLEPGVLEALESVAGRSDLPVLADLRDRVAEPARSILSHVLQSRAEAA